MLKPARTLYARMNEPGDCQGVLGVSALTETTPRGEHDGTFGIRRVECLLVLCAPHEIAAGLGSGSEDTLALFRIVGEENERVNRRKRERTTDLVGTVGG